MACRRAAACWSAAAAPAPAASAAAASRWGRRTTRTRSSAKRPRWRSSSWSKSWWRPRAACKTPAARAERLGTPEPSARRLRRRTPVAEGERHASQHDRLAVDVGPALQHADTAAQALHTGLDDDRVARTHRAAVAHAFDPAKENELVLVLGLREDQDRADLRDGFREDRGRQRRRAAAVVPQQRLVAADVLDPHDPLVQ